MRLVFVDSSYLVALNLKTDQNHAAALRHSQSLRGNVPPFITTSYIFDEVVTLFRSRGYSAEAIRAGNDIRSSTIRLIHVDDKLFDAAWQYFVQHQDKEYSFTDCVSFVLMRQRGITTAFTFDHHFTQAGFSQVP